MATITYSDKIYLNQNPSIPDINKITDNDMNEIKNVVNSNANGVGDITTLKTNDTTDLVSGVNSIIDAEVYSTTETKTNKVWIDGKPIYRKVLNLGSVNWNSTPKNFAHNISNLDTCIEVEWFGFFTTVNKWYMNWDTINAKNILISTTNVEIQNIASDATFSKNYIILEYTKTTD